MGDFKILIMMKKKLKLLGLIGLSIAYCLLPVHSVAQTDSLTGATKFKIAIFAPLYLDSAFDVAGSEYKYAKNIFPK